MFLFWHLYVNTSQTYRVKLTWRNICVNIYNEHELYSVCVTLQCPCIVGKPTYNKWADPMPALSFCPHLPFLLLCLSVHRRLSIPTSALLFERPAPTAARAPNTTTITAVLPKNKRESVRHHPLDLFHTRAPTSVPDGVAFFQGFSQPQESSKMEDPPPPGAHYSAAPHPPAPPPRARGQGTSPLYPTPAGSPIKIINHFFFKNWVLLSDITLQAVKNS